MQEKDVIITQLQTSKYNKFIYGIYVISHFNSKHFS